VDCQVEYDQAMRTGSSDRDTINCAVNARDLLDEDQSGNRILTGSRKRIGVFNADNHKTRSFVGLLKVW
jgi:hypothetical protein